VSAAMSSPCKIYQQLVVMRGGPKRRHMYTELARHGSKTCQPVTSGKGSQTRFPGLGLLIKPGQIHLITHSAAGCTSVRWRTRGSKRKGASRETVESNGVCAVFAQRRCLCTGEGPCSARGRALSNEAASATGMRMRAGRYPNGRRRLRLRAHFARSTRPAGTRP
jgi:hypothetical protein